MPQIALSNDFLRSLEKLPRKQQRKVRAFMEKFRRDPRAASINYEQLEAVADPKVRSVRIDQSYRAIVIQPPSGDVYLCVWVANHDDAYRWVTNKRFEVNPTTGSFQVYEVHDAPGDAPSATREAAPVSAGRLFAALDTGDLARCGVPEPLMPAVRALRDEQALDELSGYLPEDARDALYMLAAGFTLKQIFDELDRKTTPDAPPPEVDTEDFATALAQPASRAQFKLVEDEQELAEMLNAPLDAWRVFLHPSQRKLVEWDVAGPIKVTGGAGTGKSVVLLHRAAFLAREVFTGRDDRVLVVTFTHNLAEELGSLLRKLVADDEVFARIEVMTLHGWAMRYLRQRGVELQVETRTQRFWNKALAGHELDFPERFYRDEWEHVVQAEGIVDRRGYLTVPRTGRGTPLGRRQRAEVWKVFESYRDALDTAGRVELADVVREATFALRESSEPGPWRAVLCDETQDLRTSELRLLRAIAPRGRNSMMVVGDAHQRIYGHRASLSSCGIEVRGRSQRLRINYRTTREIRNWSVAVLEGLEIDDLDEGRDTLDGYRSLRSGPVPSIELFDSPEQEAEALRARVAQWREEGVAFEEMCVAARTSDRLERYKQVLEAASVPLAMVQRSSIDGLGDGVRLATLHRLKGLEFPRLWLAGLDTDHMPLRTPTTLDDEAAERDHLQGERCLLYVAATRARDELVISAFGEPSPWIAAR